jgi:nucleoside-diphosphate-sugar epimerase
MSKFNDFNFREFNRNVNIKIDEEIVIHLAGKAHDLKKVVDINDFYLVNTELTKQIFDAFLLSDAKVFITLSSVKAIADHVDFELTEEQLPNPITHYGKSKLLAEQYILSKEIPFGKRVYILRPTMIHGQGNKGNLNTLFKFVKLGFPWPLGSFHNKRSYCSVDNLLFIINELINREDIPSGIYNISDDIPVATNDIIKIMNEALSQKTLILFIPKPIINFVSNICTLFNLPFSKENLNKLTDTYIVSNFKIKNVIGKQLPINSIDGLNLTINYFVKNMCNSTN